MSEYGKRNAREQGEHYTRHVLAMTAEGLHSKSDIAAELAHRDIQISQLQTENERLRGVLQKIFDEVNFDETPHTQDRVLHWAMEVLQPKGEGDEHQ